MLTSEGFEKVVVPESVVAIEYRKAIQSFRVMKESYQCDVQLGENTV